MNDDLEKLTAWAGGLTPTLLLDVFTETSCMTTAAGALLTVGGLEIDAETRLQLLAALSTLITDAKWLRERVLHLRIDSDKPTSAEKVNQRHVSKVTSEIGYILTVAALSAMHIQEGDLQVSPAAARLLDELAEEAQQAFGELREVLRKIAGEDAGEAG